MDKPRKYIVYDERAILGNTDDASIFCMADSLKEAKQDIREMFPDQGCCVYSYETEENNLIKEKFEWSDRQ